MKRFKDVVPGNIPVRDIRVEHISRFVFSMKQKLSQATMVTYFQYLSSMLNFLKDSGFIEKVPIPKGLRPKKAVKNIIYFSLSDLKNILNLAKLKDTKYYLVYKLLLLTGQRPGDILKIKVGDFDLYRSVLNMKVSKTNNEFKFPIYDQLRIFLINEIKRNTSWKVEGWSFQSTMKMRIEAAETKFYIDFPIWICY
jgi:integrase